MATIKSCTDLEQSKKLAEILPLETADMFLAMNGILPVISKYIDNGLVPGDNTAIPCWSLAALVSILPMIRKGEDTANPFIAKTPDNEYYIVYATLTEEVDASPMYDNPIDACVTMIETLHELNLL